MYGRFATAGLTSVLSLWILTLCQAELGLFAEAIANGEHAVRIARTADHKLSIMFADLGLGHVYLAQGDLARAIPALERGFGTCRTWDLPMWTPWLASRAGAAYVLAARLTDALPLLEQSMEQSRSMGWVADLSPATVRLSEAYLAAGRVQEARTLADSALDLAREHKGRGQQAWALRLRGEIAFRHDRPDVDHAEGQYREALALAEELDMRPLVAHCHLGLGKLYRHTDKREQAHEHLTAATRMYREMAMGFWLERVGAEMSALG